MYRTSLKCKYFLQRNSNKVVAIHKPMQIQGDLNARNQPDASYMGGDLYARSLT